MHQNATSCIEPILYETVTGGEVFEQVLIVNVVDFHNLMSEICEQILLKW